MLYVFGRIVEEEEGGLGVWLTYIVCSVGTPLLLLGSLQCFQRQAQLTGADTYCLGVGGSLASYFTMPHNCMSLGASGAVFGLFAVSGASCLAEL